MINSAMIYKRVKRVVGLLLLAVVLCLAGSVCSSERNESGQATELYSAQTHYDRIVEVVGLPEQADTEGRQLLVRKSYVVLYNSRTLQPDWVIWRLTAEHAQGDVPRSNNFREDEEVARPRATLDDYKRSGWDRGHMCPAGDNKWDEEAMDATFLLSNMCPQDASLNSGVWNQIEMDCRSLAERYGELYIVCGPVAGEKPLEQIGERAIPVPRRFFKAVYCPSEPAWGAGFVCTNDGMNASSAQYVCTIEEVEEVTGLRLFPLVTDDGVRTAVNRRMW